MSKFTNPLDSVRIASPCPADWDAMTGDERRRFCGQCNLNVYNLSGMTRAEAEYLLANSEGRLCVRFYRRADGTILTRDCPVGWAALKRTFSRAATACVSLLFGLLSGLGLTTYFNRVVKPERVTGRTIYVPPALEPQKPLGEPVMGDYSVVVVTPVKKEQTQVLGRVSEPVSIAGVISNIEEVRRQAKRNRRR